MLVHLSPVEYVCKLFGGVRKVAPLAKVTPGTVSRWSRNGRMTVRAQLALLEEAKARGLDLKPDDLVVGRDVEKRRR